MLMRLYGEDVGRLTDKASDVVYLMGIDLE
jgi:hypothetical protein